MSGSSPHTRGAPDFDNFWRRARGIIPAYAGSTASGRVWRPRFGDHPRIRGEHTGPGRSVRIGRGSSPHTRGARLRLVEIELAPGIIPAYAGSTASPLVDWTTVTDHPRIRGEHDYAKRAPAGLKGSSPHTRGALVWFPADENAVGIIPAYAGSTRRGVLRCSLTRGSSPHTRGAHRPLGRPCSGTRIIPAYAGSTTLRLLYIQSSLGSSPHTRGARK
mgnify:CR=1 FL=1